MSAVVQTPEQQKKAIIREMATTIAAHMQSSPENGGRPEFVGERAVATAKDIYDRTERMT